MQLGMHMVYDVTHNTAKQEEHVVNGEKKQVLVHRKGATRAYPPGHPSLPDRLTPFLATLTLPALLHSKYGNMQQQQWQDRFVVQRLLQHTFVTSV